MSIVAIDPGPERFALKWLERAICEAHQECQHRFEYCDAHGQEAALMLLNNPRLEQAISWVMSDRERVA